MSLLSFNSYTQFLSSLQSILQMLIVCALAVCVVKWTLTRRSHADTNFDFLSDFNRAHLVKGKSVFFATCEVNSVLVLYKVFAGEMTHSFNFYLKETKSARGQSSSRMKQTGMLFENFELNPKGDQSGHGSSFFWPIKETKNTNNIIYFSLFLRVQP